LNYYEQVWFTSLLSVEFHHVK